MPSFTEPIVAISLTANGRRGVTLYAPPWQDAEGEEDKESDRGTLHGGLLRMSRRGLVAQCAGASVERGRGGVIRARSGDRSLLIGARQRAVTRQHGVEFDNAACAFISIASGSCISIFLRDVSSRKVPDVPPGR